MKKRIVIGISGASGVIYGIRLLEILKKMGSWETHLVITEAAKKNIEIETDYRIEDVEEMASFSYAQDDMTAPISSGSFLTEGMVVIPCAIKSLSGIANSFNTNLLVRAADVTLKEKRRLILVVRETPLHMGHLELMKKAALMGAIILPPIPSFYHQPKSIQDIIDHIIGKILDHFKIEHQLYKRWSGVKQNRLSS